VLAEQAGHVLSRGRQAVVQSRGISISTMGRFDHPPALASRYAGPCRLGSRHDDARGVMLASALPAIRRNPASSTTRRSCGTFRIRIASDRCARENLAAAPQVDERSVQQLRIQIRDDTACSNRFAILGDDTDGSPGLNQYFAHRLDTRISTPRSAALGHRLRDGTMPPMAWPRPFLPFTSPKRGAGAHTRNPPHKTRIIADDAVESICRLDGALSNQASR